MSERRTPQNLIINRDTIVSLDMSGDLGFFPRDDYLLVEITNRIKIFETRKLIAHYSKEHKKPVAIRGIGPGLNTAIVMVHLILNEEKVYDENIEALTFSAQDSKKQDQKPRTGIQLVIFPKNN